VNNVQKSMLASDTEVVCKVLGFYSPESDGGIVLGDLGLAIAWPIEGREPVLSQEDQSLLRLAEFSSPF
jgi:dTDP-4-dehydrorhamnose 3,5-epimerase